MATDLTDCNLTALEGISGVEPSTPPSMEEAFDKLYEDVGAFGPAGHRFGASFKKSGWLRALLAGQGLLAGFGPVWPTNISFELLLAEVGGGLPPNGSGFVLNIGAGDGKRADIYHKPMDPTWPLFARGMGGLAVEPNRRYDHHCTGDCQTAALKVPAMAFASGSLSMSLSEVNTTGTIHIAWASAEPESIQSLLVASSVPETLDALAIDTDSHEAALLEAIVTAGYRPRAIAININPDIPPPIQIRHTRATHGAAAAAGLAAASADAVWHVLAPRGYTFVAFQFGRFSRWCHRCEQRMWFVRSDAAKGLETTWGDMVRMFWAHIYASTVAPRSLPGKILAHSSSWAMWRAKFDEGEAMRVAAQAWNGTALAGGGQPYVAKFGSREENGTWKGWCLRADPCPLHVITHAWAVAGADLPLQCTAPSRGKSVFLKSLEANVAGGLSTPSWRPAIFAAVTERLLEQPPAGLCSYIQSWLQETSEALCARKGVCDATSGIEVRLTRPGGPGSAPVTCPVPR